MLKTVRCRAPGALAVAAAACTLCGCAKPLLSPDEERSQYDRYDAVRNQYAAQYTQDEFGKQVPNLRARLAPKE